MPTSAFVLSWLESSFRAWLIAFAASAAFHLLFTRRRKACQWKMFERPHDGNVQLLIESHIQFLHINLQRARGNWVHQLSLAERENKKCKNKRKKQLQHRVALEDYPTTSVSHLFLLRCRTSGIRGMWHSVLNDVPSHVNYAPQSFPID